MSPSARLYLMMVSALVVCGCGPIEYIANVPMEASGLVAEAKHVKAEKYAPYEITAATEYLHKSRELGGYARFHSSVQFAQKATKLAQQAKQLSADRAAMPEERNEENAPAPVADKPATVTIKPANPNDDHTAVPTIHTDKPGQ